MIIELDPYSGDEIDVTEIIERIKIHFRANPHVVKKSRNATVNAPLRN